MVLWCQIITSGILLSILLIEGSSIYIRAGEEHQFLHESKLIMISLEKALNYLMSHPESVTDDVILGVFITKANLQWIHDRLKFYDNSLQEEHLKRLLRQCRILIEISKARNFGLLNESLWENSAENLKYGVLSRRDDEFLLPKFDSCQSIDTYMMKGTPENSDFCINELINSSCNVSENCWISEMNEDFHSGYKNTHRLLYFQIACKIKCNEMNPQKFSNVGIIKNKLCQQILSEAEALFKESSLSLIRDLFMEQIALCGLEGHEEFSVDVWRDQVRRWQNSAGCYGLDENFKKCSVDGFQKYENNNKLKRTDFAIDDCHTHVTAVAISALAFFLRVSLKMAFNLP